MHYWGEWPDELFRDVENAAYEIGEFCRRWGKIQVTQTKEKYGTARVYCHFGCRDLHSIFYPGYVAVWNPKWLFQLVGETVGYRIMTFPFLRWAHPAVYRWQKFIYRLAYRRAVAKYPRVREEILAGADFDELLVGL
jgi:hypothetical protein